MLHVWIAFFAYVDCKNLGVAFCENPRGIDARSRRCYVKSY